MKGAPAQQYSHVFNTHVIVYVFTCAKSLFIAYIIDITVNNSKGQGAMKKKWAAVCRFGGIGDNLIVSSVLPLLAETHNVEVITKEPQSVIFENNPYIDKLSVKREGDLPSDGLQWQQWFDKRSAEYDRFYHLSHSIESLVAFMPTQGQFYWPSGWRRKWSDKNYLEIAHDVCEVRYDFAPQFFPTEEEQEKALATKKLMGERVIGWCLGGSRVDKTYPYGPAAIERLIRETGMPVVMLGAGTHNFQAAKQIEAGFKAQNGGEHPGLHLALSPDMDKPSWPVRRLLAQALTCDILIGPDTGIMWAGAMQEMPKVMMLSHASETNITKHWKNTTTLHASDRVPCWPCHQLHDTVHTCRSNADNTGAACISDIPVQALMDAVAAL
jgi:ADP-heptose:LPS heptosyltransferase